MIRSENYLNYERSMLIYLREKLEFANAIK